MKKIKPFILPIAIILGLILHKWCAIASPAVPYVIFSILLLTFSNVDLMSLRPSKLDLWLVLFQVCVSIGGYCLLVVCGVNDIIAEGILIGVLCPVASSVTVISCMLGADKRTVVTYTIIGNLMVAFVAPVMFAIIGHQSDISLWKSMMMIMSRIFSALGIPLLIAFILQRFLPNWNARLAKYSGLAFYLWCFALLFTLGQTIDFIFIHGQGNEMNIMWLGICALLLCVIQFAFGKRLGKKYGDKIGGGQLLGQKNTAIGIWMANTFLSPLASVILAFYSVFQNIFNSWQIWQHDRIHK